MVDFANGVRGAFSSSVNLTVLNVANCVRRARNSVIRGSRAGVTLFLLAALIPTVNCLLVLIPVRFCGVANSNRHRVVGRVVREHTRLGSRGNARTRISRSITTGS